MQTWDRDVVGGENMERATLYVVDGLALPRPQPVPLQWRQPLSADIVLKKDEEGVE